MRMDMNVAVKTSLTRHRTSLRALTGIRFLAAAYVVIFHTTLGPRLVQQGHALTGNFFENGFLAVALFFLLSGFILSYTYNGQIESGGDKRRFWEARIARVWPVYIFSLVLTALVQETSSKLSYAIASVFMLQAWNPFDHGMWGAGNYVCWTLSVEALFYLVFPWVQIEVEKLGVQRLLVFLFASLALCVGLNTGAYTLGYPSHGLMYLLPLPLVRLPEFLVGVGLGNFFLRINADTAKREDLSIFRDGGLVTYCSAFAALVCLTFATGRWCSLVILPFSLLLLGLAKEKSALSSVLSSRALAFGGGISYSIYLLQTAAKDGATLIATRFGIGSTSFRMGIMTLLLILASCFAYKFIEEPARRAIRKAFAQRETRRDQAKRRNVPLPSLQDAGS